MSEGRPGHFIAPIFIPNLGCPHKCVFCDQEKITSFSGQKVDARHVEDVLDLAVGSRAFARKTPAEVAFYGGTFTMLSEARIKDLLGAVQPYIKKGHFQSIRVSTRPDALDDRRLRLMKDYGVLTVELGVQSMDDEVLSLSGRGHSAGDTARAVQALKRHGFKVGIQLMPGLPGDSDVKFRSTITQVIKLHPDMVRLYPAVVIHGTELERLYIKGLYEPLSVDKAVDICIESCTRLENEGIPVIRIGLMSSPTLLEKGQIVAGPWHTAFGFLVRSGIYQRRIAAYLPEPGEAAGLNIYLKKSDLPLIRGYKNEGIKWIENLTGAKVIKVQPDDQIPAGTIKVKKV
ncbi:MAG: radical SAM protein [Deltaproteobacteria bacterium]|nr:radical SAM protein [Deltaproteobacteria bacterium]